MPRSIRWFGLAALVVLGLAAGPARAQVVPWKVTGSGGGTKGFSILGDDSPYSASGRATHLGKYTGSGIVQALSFDPQSLSGTFRGTYTFVTKNGDKLACTHGDTDNGAEEPGTYQVYPAAGGKVYVVYVAEFNPIPSECTGRFQNVVDGSLIMVATSEPFDLTIDENGFTPPFGFTWEGSGWLQYKRGK